MGSESAQNQLGEFFEIPTSIFTGRLDVNMAPLPMIDFYLLSEDGKPKLIRRATQPFSAFALDLYPTIWIRGRDLATIKDLTEKLLTDPALTSHLPTEKRMRTLRRSALMVVDDLFEHPSPANFTRSVKIVSSFVHELIREPQGYFHLVLGDGQDPYTLRHSIGTAASCIILARKCGITDEEDLIDVGTAGLLHDIGNSKTSKEILNKPGPLTHDEWQEMQRHTNVGYSLVKDLSGLTDRTKRAILEHHEDREGTGYPSGILFDQIDLFSKIVAICDVFNALTSEKVYSRARTPYEAFKLMRDRLTHKLDPDLFERLVMVYGGEVS